MTGTGCRNVSFDANLIYISTNSLSASCSIKVRSQAEPGLLQRFNRKLLVSEMVPKRRHTGFRSEHRAFAAFRFVVLSLAGLSLLKISHLQLIYFL